MIWHNQKGKVAQSGSSQGTFWIPPPHLFPVLNFSYLHSFIVTIFCSHPAFSESLDILPALSLSFSLENKSISTSPFIYFFILAPTHTNIYTHNRYTDNNSNSLTYTYIQCYFYCVKSCHLGLLVSTICHMIHLGADSKVLNLAWNPNRRTLKFYTQICRSIIALKNLQPAIIIVLLLLADWVIYGNLCRNKNVFFCHHPGISVKTQTHE